MTEERMSEEPVHPDPSGRIPPGARVVVTWRKRQESATVVDNQGPAYLVRFDDGAEAWYDRKGVERENPAAGEWGRRAGEERSKAPEKR